MHWIMKNGVPNRQKTARQVVADYLNSEYGVYFKPFANEVTTDDIYVVWFCKTLRNWKALLSTDIVNTGIYFEVTYNGDTNEIYLDHYKKVHNEAISMQSPLPEGEPHAAE
jgi:hypothetical protein